jgi:hypothetical protein
MPMAREYIVIDILAVCQSAPPGTLEYPMRGISEGVPDPQEITGDISLSAEPSPTSFPSSLRSIVNQRCGQYMHLS